MHFRFGIELWTELGKFFLITIKGAFPSIRFLAIAGTIIPFNRRTFSVTGISFLGIRIIAVTGTFSGAVALSGIIAIARTFSGAVALSGIIAIARTFSGAVALSGIITIARTFSGAVALSGIITIARIFSGAVALSGIITIARIFSGAVALSGIITIARPFSGAVAGALSVVGGTIFGIRPATGATSGFALIIRALSFFGIFFVRLVVFRAAMRGYCTRFVFLSRQEFVYLFRG